MADIINNVGVGHTYETISAWLADRPNDGNNWIGLLTDAADYVGGTFTGSHSGDLILRAAPMVAYNFDSPSNAHARIYAATSNSIYIRYTTPFIIEGVELRADSLTSTNVFCGLFEACNVTLNYCLVSGGRHGTGAVFSGAQVQLNNSIVTDTQEWGIRGAVGGVGAKNTSVIRCNTANANFRGGIQSTVGSVWDSVVAYDNNSPDWFSPEGTFINCASGDSSATGTGAVTGVTDADFTSIDTEVFTAANGGLLDGTGSDGSNIGYDPGSTNSLILITPTPNDFHGRVMPANTGTIGISLSYSGDVVPTAIEASWNGGAFTTIDAAPSGGTASGSLTGLASGNGDLTVRYVNDPSISVIQTNVAIGAKYLFWGQSNFSGRASNAQTYTGTAGYFHKYTVTNNEWELGDDPFDTATANGSLFPLLANQLVAELGVPVALIGVAQGSTTLSQWQAGEVLNNRMLSYITSTGGNDIEGIASWIGEGDALAVTPEATFKSEYDAVILQLKTLTGKDSVLCGIAQAGSDSDNVRQWIQDIVSTNDDAIRYVDMAAVFTGIHYINDADTLGCATALFEGFFPPVVISSTLNMVDTDTPDGTYPFKVWNTVTSEIVTTSDILFSSGDGSIVLNVEVGTNLLAFTPGDDSPVTGIAFNGVTE